MILYGLLTTPIVLGAKQDLCATCHVAGPHVIVRRARWIEIFFFPVMPIWVNHRLICTNCGAETKLGFGQVRQALSSGKLPMPHREGFEAYATALWEDNQRRPSEVEFDPVEKNPKRSGWNTYLKLWPAIVLAAVVAITFWPRPAPAPVVRAHECWVASDDSLAGCRMTDGTVVGEAVGDPTTCFFVEPMPTGRINCSN